jgi:ribose transport system ATP-binding protein
MELLTARHIKKNFGGVQALKDGCIECNAGRIIGLLGANGSGKTTFSKILCGIYNATGGEICLRGKKVTIGSAKEARYMGIAMAHQQLSLVPDLTVSENINLGHEPGDRIGGVDKKLSKEIALNIMNEIDSGIPMETKAKNLSPSQKQLVEIGKAISQNPQVLVLDEPTASLEQGQVNHLFTILKKFISENRTIIFISHRLWEVTQICDEIVVFRNGNTVGKIDFTHEEKDDEKIIELITGETQKNLNYFHESVNLRTDLHVTQPVLDAQIKLKHKKEVEKEISLRLFPGEIVGLSGLQGQGQPELLLTLFGSRPYNGEIRINGEAQYFHHPQQAINAGIVFVPGDRQLQGLFLSHSVLLNTIYPDIAKRKKNKFVRYSEYKRRAEEMIDRLSINPKDKSLCANQLSGGNQQKVVFGKWLFDRPTIMLLDDPTKGVDIQAKSELFAILMSLASEGTTILIYSSDNEELLSICTRVLVMFEGEIVEEVSGDRLNEETLVDSAIRGKK